MRHTGRRLTINDIIGLQDALDAVPAGGGGGGAVSSVFGRTGAVTANTNDYSVAQINGLTSQLAGKAASVHTHAESDITGLVSDLAAKEATANKGAASGYASLDAGTKVPIAQIPTGTTGSTVPFGNDSRFTDARTPTAHATTHQPGGSDAMAVDAAAATGSLRTLGTGAAQAAAGNHTHTHASTTGQTPNDHHNQAHVLATNAALGADHTISGAAAGQVLRASSATAANFQALAAGDLPTHTHAESDITNLVADLAAKDPLVTRLKLTANQAVIGTTATAITGFTSALLASTAYRFRAKVYYVCTVTGATLASRAAYSGTLAAAANGQSIFKVRGGSGVPTVWAATYRECTGAVNAAIATATGGIGAVGSASVAEFEIEGIIFTNATGNLTIEVVGSAASSITVQAGSQIEIWKA